MIALRIHFIMILIHLYLPTSRRRLRRASLSRLLFHRIDILLAHMIPSTWQAYIYLRSVLTDSRLDPLDTTPNIWCIYRSLLYIAVGCSLPPTFTS